MNTLRDEKMYLRARIGRNIKCPKCNTSYRTDNRRSPSRRAPVLLSCGHSCCETCSQSSLLYICSLCSEKTRVIRGQLPKHLYIFGLVAESYSLPINLEHLEMRLDPIRMFAAKEHMKEICQECRENKASLRCRKCLSELCDPCFKKIHAHKTMKKHTAEPLHSVTSAYLRPPCASHPEVIVTHVCYTCSTEVVGQIMFCTTCFVFGPHLQHEVVEFSKLAEQYMTEVKVGIEELTGAIDQLEESRLWYIIILSSDIFTSKLGSIEITSQAMLNCDVDSFSVVYWYIFSV
ncbi:E3 ubiquitin-protein ligase TRIM23-like [Penaeus japonicus]|uniref:E3 ubiquitin-protein ligase TRIM23-like n=1 Tax=Penaeus japonicus TaxID=27405 RepID=UPI001C7143CC|nr:E3 ubiquitin-protein ligase TRIM23-like [Penaeus japonicus]